MTELERKLTRKSSGTVYEAGKRRRILIILIPSAKIGLRLEGTKRTYTLDAESAYSIAVKFHLNEIERRAKQIAKSEGLKIRSARAKARRELDKKLKV